MSFNDCGAKDVRTWPHTLERINQKALKSKPHSLTLQLLNHLTPLPGKTLPLQQGIPLGKSVYRKAFDHGIVGVPIGVDLDTEGAQ